MAARNIDGSCIATISGAQQAERCKRVDPLTSPESPVLPPRARMHSSDVAAHLLAAMQNALFPPPQKLVRSAELMERARRRIPGGVNSPVRAFGAVGAAPVFLVRGRGCTVIDADGRHYTDYVGAWGPLLLGHAHPDVERAVGQALERGTAFR